MYVDSMTGTGMRECFETKREAPSCAPSGENDMEISESVETRDVFVGRWIPRISKPDARKTGDQRTDSDLCLYPGKGCAEAEVPAPAERHLMNRVSVDVKAVRFGMEGRVAIGGSKCQPEPLTRLDRASVKVEICHRDPIADGDWWVVPQHFLYCVDDQRGI